MLHKWANKCFSNCMSPCLFQSDEINVLLFGRQVPPTSCHALRFSDRDGIDALQFGQTYAFSFLSRPVFSERNDIKLRNLLAPMFIAVSGSSRSLPLFDSMSILGRSVVRQRLKQAELAVKAGVEAAKANNG